MKRYLQDFLSVVKTLGTETDEVKDKIILSAMTELFSDSRCGCEVLTDVANAIMEKECDNESD